MYDLRILQAAAEAAVQAESDDVLGVAGVVVDELEPTSPSGAVAAENHGGTPFSPRGVDQHQRMLASLLDGQRTSVSTAAALLSPLRTSAASFLPLQDKEDEEEQLRAHAHVYAR